MGNEYLVRDDAGGDGCIHQVPGHDPFLPVSQHQHLSRLQHLPRQQIVQHAEPAEISLCEAKVSFAFNFRLLVDSAKEVVIALEVSTDLSGDELWTSFDSFSEAHIASVEEFFPHVL